MVLQLAKRGTPVGKNLRQCLLFLGWCLVWLSLGWQCAFQAHLQPSAAPGRLKRVFLSARGAKEAPLHPAQLTHLIQATRSPSEVLQLLDTHGASVNTLHLSLGLYTIAKKPDQVTDTARLEDFVQSLEYECMGMSQRSLAALAWAATQLHSKLDMTGLATAVASATAKKTDHMSARDLSSIIWSLAKVHVKHKGLMDAAASRASKSIAEFNVLDLSNLAWGFAVLGERHADMMSKVAKRVRSCVGHATVQHISNIAWSFARLGVRDELMMDDMAKTVVAKQRPYGRMKWVNWGNILLAFATLNVHNEALVDACASDLSVSELRRSTRWSICAISVACSTLRAGKQLARLRQEVENEVRRRGIAEAELECDLLDPAAWSGDTYIKPLDVGHS